MQCVADRYRHGGTAHRGGQTAYRIVNSRNRGDRLRQRPDVELGSQGVDDRSDEERTEETLGHGAEGVDAVAFEGDFDVFAFHKCFECVQCVPLFL